MFPNLSWFRTTSAATGTSTAQRDTYIERINWEDRRRSHMIRLFTLVFLAVIIFFGIRGTLSFWSGGLSSANCPSRAAWMADSAFICNRPIPTPVLQLDMMNPYRVLRLDCLLSAPVDMGLVYNLCCANTRVFFERVNGGAELTFENGTSTRLTGNSMAAIMTSAKGLFCQGGSCDRVCV